MPSNLIAFEKEHEQCFRFGQGHVQIVISSYQVIQEHNSLSRGHAVWLKKHHIFNSLPFTTFINKTLKSLIATFIK